MNRRELVSALASAGALWSAPWSQARAAGSYSEDRYASAIVIDALGGPGDYRPDVPDDAPLSPRALADVRLSGITLCHMTVGPVGNEPNQFEATINGFALAERELAAHPDLFLKVLRGGDIALAKRSGRMGIVFGLQDSIALEGSLKRLTTLHGLGLRVAQPTYNRRSLMGDGCLEENDSGLSQLGHDFVAELNRLGILLDLSHAGRRTIADGIRSSQRPMAITHTGCRALVDVPRNTDDDNLKALAERGGVAGMYFMPFLRASGQPHAEDLIRHLEHAVNVCGEEHVGLGTDGLLSGIELTDAYRASHRKEVEARRKAGISAPGESAEVFNLIPEYNDPRRFFTLAGDLAQRGWSESRIDKILGGNFARLFGEVWGK